MSELGHRGIDLLGRELAEDFAGPDALAEITGARYPIQTAPIDHGRTPFPSYPDQTLVIRGTYGSEYNA